MDRNPEINGGRIYPFASSHYHLKEISMGKPMSDFNFRFMSFGYRFRDLFLPRRNVLDEVGIKAGANILDYGCGPGSYSVIAAQLVGATGKVYALDCFPRQLEMVAEQSKQEGLTNTKTILSSRETGLPDECVDVVWMCDVLHEIKERRAVLEELHRILRQNGTLALYDGMKKRVLSYTTGLFTLTERDGKFLKFTKIKIKRGAHWG